MLRSFTAIYIQSKDEDGFVDDALTRVSTRGVRDDETDDDETDDDETDDDDDGGAFDDFFERERKRKAVWDGHS